MAKLIILRGVPASGKSTVAEQYREMGFTIVNRDNIRYIMFGKYWGVDEQVVTDVENAMIESSLRADTSVVLDATNLNRKNLKTKLSLASRYGAEVDYLSFAVPLTVALERDRARERQVGEAVIKNFFRRYKINAETGRLPEPPDPLPKFERYVVDVTKPTAYVVDTDGTVANHEGVRNPYDTTKYHLDSVHEHVAEIVSQLYGAHQIIALSGRDAAFREVTEGWWNGHGLAFDEFHMRPKGDTRMDAIIKYELFKEHIEPNYNVLGAFDDRPQVIRMWRTIGVPVIDVGNGVEF
jgi:predicted kinase